MKKLYRLHLQRFLIPFPLVEYNIGEGDVGINLTSFSGRRQSYALAGTKNESAFSSFEYILKLLVFK